MPNTKWNASEQKKHLILYELMQAGGPLRRKDLKERCVGRISGVTFSKALDALSADKTILRTKLTRKHVVYKPNPESKLVRGGEEFLQTERVANKNLDASNTERVRVFLELMGLAGKANVPKSKRHKSLTLFLNSLLDQFASYIGVQTILSTEADAEFPDYARSFYSRINEENMVNAFDAMRRNVLKLMLVEPEIWKVSNEWVAKMTLQAEREYRKSTEALLKE
jgi:hypothetical protein